MIHQSSIRHSSTGYCCRFVELALGRRDEEFELGFDFDGKFLRLSEFDLDDPRDFVF